MWRTMPCRCFFFYLGNELESHHFFIWLLLISLSVTQLLFYCCCGRWWCCRCCCCCCCCFDFVMFMQARFCSHLFWMENMWDVQWNPIAHVCSSYRWFLLKWRISCSTGLIWIVKFSFLGIVGLGTITIELPKFDLRAT